MRALVWLHQLNQSVGNRLPAVAYEARLLFHRRKISYAVLAATLAGTVLYAGTMGHTLVTQAETGQTNTTQNNNGGSAMQNQDSAQGNANKHQNGATNQSNDSYSAGSSAQSQMSVTVNGQPMAVPENGTVHTDIPNGNGRASVDISHLSSGTSSSYIHVDVSSTSGGGAQDP